MKYNNSDNTDKDTIQHPDYEWIKEIRHWKLCGTLTFKTRYLDTQNDKVKDFFARYNWHLTGEYNWKNVPVYWRWELDDTERLHAHFVHLPHTGEFDWLTGCENQFKSPNDLAIWMKYNWNHGISHYQTYNDNGWLKYITKPNSMMCSCYSPPIHYLKKQVQAGKVGSFWPWLEHDYVTPTQSLNN